LGVNNEVIKNFAYLNLTIADALLDKSLVTARQQDAFDDTAFLRITALELEQHAKRDAHLKNQVHIFLLLAGLFFI